MIAVLAVFPAIAKKYKRDVVLVGDVEWSALNPARGDQSPKAGQLWGDRTTEGAAGFLVEFSDGFSSPPHIHNVSYRGLVINGLVHNNDPSAQNMWMPEGSYWTQPAGESHITAAKGEKNVAYIEIDDGPYLVKHVDEEFDSFERPINIHASNMIWLDAAAIVWINQDNGVQISFLWGRSSLDDLGGSLIKVPAGFDGYIQSSGSEFRAVVINGSMNSEDVTLAEGSYFGSDLPQKYKITAQEEVLIYIRTNGKYKILN